MLRHAPVCLCVLRMWVGHAEQVSEIVHCWVSGSEKKNTWLVKTVQYVLSTFELFLVLFLLSWLLWVGWQHSALISALDSAKYVRYEGLAALSFPSSITQKRCPPQLCPPSTSSCNARFNDAQFLRMSANWDSEHECKLLFLSMGANWRS